MRHSLKILGTVAAVAALTFVAYLFGRLSSNASTIEQLKRETAGNLGRHVEMLARLRTGDAEGAAQLLEQSVDIAVATLPQGRAFADEPTSVQNVLMAAKTYRTAYVTKDASAGAVLKDVQSLPVDHKHCSPALGEIAKRAATRAAANQTLQWIGPGVNLSPPATRP